MAPRRAKRNTVVELAYSHADEDASNASAPRSAYSSIQSGRAGAAPSAFAYSWQSCQA